MTLRDDVTFGTCSLRVWTSRSHGFPYLKDRTRSHPFGGICSLQRVTGEKFDLVSISSEIWLDSL